MPSQTTECIACGSRDVALVPMHFMGEQAQVPVCGACEPYFEKVFEDSSFALGFARFLGVTNVERSDQMGGAVSMMVRDGDAPADLGSRMSDLDRFCAFIGERIREMRPG